MHFLSLPSLFVFYIFSRKLTKERGVFIYQVGPDAFEQGGGGGPGGPFNGLNFEDIFGRNEGGMNEVHFLLIFLIVVF